MSRHIPEGYTTVAPWVVTRDTARLVDFITAAFEGTEVGRVYVEDGSIGHAEIRIGDSIVLAFDARDDWPDTPCFLRVYVEDADATYARALGAGARGVTAIADSAWGDRGGRVRDPLGNIWWIMSRVEDVDPDEMAVRAAQPQHVDAMRYAQQTLDAELSGRDIGVASPPVW